MSSTGRPARFPKRFPPYLAAAAPFFEKNASAADAAAVAKGLGLLRKKWSAIAAENAPQGESEAKPKRTPEETFGATVGRLYKQRRTIDADRLREEVGRSAVSQGGGAGDTLAEAIAQGLLGSEMCTSTRALQATEHYDLFSRLADEHKVQEAVRTPVDLLYQCLGGAQE